MLTRHSRSSIAGYAIDHRAGVEVAPHAHDEGQLSVVVKGTMTLTAEEGWWLAPPGLAIWVPPQTQHSAYYSESSSLLQIEFSSRFASQMPERCGAIVASELLCALAREAIRAAPNDCEYETLDLLAQLMVIQARRHQEGPGLFVPHGRDRRLRLATDLLRENPGANIHFEELATHACTSPRTLARLFRSETGMPFGRWREHLRIVSAVNKLARGLSITQTALELGYANPSSFTTLFTRLVGLPPRRYMQRLQSRTQHAADLPGERLS